MNKTIIFIRRAGIMLVLWLFTAGCGIAGTTPVGETKTETQNVELGAANEARVQITMAAGELAVTGGAGTLMDATFRYNVDEWQPRVEYTLNGSEGMLLVEQQGEDRPVGGNLVNQWTLSLSNEVPIDLVVETGAGETQLDLRGLDLTALDVAVGAGNTEIDLSEALDHDLSVAIEGGVGQLSVKLPADMGVQVAADTGIGGLTNSGLVQDGEFYVNEALGVAPHTLFVDISAGIGEIELLAP